MLRKVGFQYALLVTLALTVFSVSAKPITFYHQGDRLSGHYLAPREPQQLKAVLIFVHGDGATTHDAEGYYALLWQPLRNAGYAILSWDKPGVGKSTGDWLNQSMQDRSSEVLAAIDWVKTTVKVPNEQIGLVGFSQAGWVVPAIAKADHVGFAVGIGFATNWLAQGRYYTETALRLEGKSETAILAELKRNEEFVTYLKTSPSYPEYVEMSGSTMTRQRYGFVLRNFQVDASDALSGVSVPTLLLWGDSDLNVDAQNEHKRWYSSANTHLTTVLIENATHGLLDAEAFTGQTFTLGDWMRLVWLDSDALADGFLPTLLQWLDDHVEQRQENM
ncbi:alpha/beta hydrolase family protein [Thaumasiovibrio subtropicus]|uniref:alpha/beta hydrolase family protein n=1 Tax=Thaumasiovibrio subtropicus TaxID=1891207 RepID=UPI00131D873D|nr:alpha/beta hydrolase [Thaumasiovibrio subtropicus]